MAILKIVKFIFKCLISKKYRDMVLHVIFLVENGDELDNKLQEELDLWKDKYLVRYKKRIDLLGEVKSYTDKLPLAASVSSKINDLMNDIKEEYREIENNH